MAFDVHCYANSRDEILLLSNHIHSEKAFVGVQLKYMRYSQREGICRGAAQVHALF